jgi:hypothetical protein
MMDIDNIQPSNDSSTSDKPPSLPSTTDKNDIVSWTVDASITDLSEDIFSQIQKQNLYDSAGETEHHSIYYEVPKDSIKTK